jgi:predicted AlkP superfamily phosphohydrolase/phosphomutase
LRREGGTLHGSLEGPINDLIPDTGVISIPFCVNPFSLTLEIAGQRHQLEAGVYSPWIKLTFRALPGLSVSGIVRFLVTQTEPEFSLYATPIQIDPDSPALPISHPPYYAAYLAKLLGPFATVGMAEDTWALNEGVINESEFLEQAYLTMAEREAMFDNALAHTERGVVACVFDTSDRVQHMCFRDVDQPASAIEDLYQRMDRLVGKAMRHINADTLLMVLSDHGFCAFRRAVNINSWLHQNGYLALHDDAAVASGRYFEGVDWSRTRAYCLGLSGLYINRKGREGQGLVEPGAETQALTRELIEKLSGLPDGSETAIRTVYATNKLYRGPYLDAAPDLIVGYNEGYRVSWDAAVGKVTPHIIEDNPKAWSGDHCVDPVLVPGVLFCNRAIDVEDPGIEDMAPTALALFGLTPPAWMEGKPLFRATT